jgi:hypothetical protein
MVPPTAEQAGVRRRVCSAPEQADAADGGEDLHQEQASGYGPGRSRKRGNRAQLEAREPGVDELGTRRVEAGQLSGGGRAARCREDARLRRAVSDVPVEEPLEGR